MSKLTNKPWPSIKRINEGICPTCNLPAKLLATRVFNMEICWECLKTMAKKRGWL